MLVCCALSSERAFLVVSDQWSVVGGQGSVFVLVSGIFVC